MKITLPTDIRQHLADEVRATAAMLSLEIQSEPFLGATLSLPDGRTIWRDGFRAFFPADDQAILAGAVCIVRAIHYKFGPGRIWCPPGAGLVDLVGDGGDIYVDDQGSVCLRAVFGHERSATGGA